VLKLCAGESDKTAKFSSFGAGILDEQNTCETIDLV
jgi:hypothetical protein